MVKHGMRGCVEWHMRFHRGHKARSRSYRSADAEWWCLRPRKCIIIGVGLIHRHGLGAPQVEVLCLIRHGETDWNRAGRFQGVQDIPLNAVGADQATRCGLWLAREPWDAVLCSPLIRAKKSAEIIAEHVRVESVCVVANLRERDYGDATGLTGEQVASRYPDGHVPNMEERTSVTHRAMRALQWAIDRHAGKKVVLVSHGAFINSVLAMVSDGQIGSGKTVLKNACISQIIHVSGSWGVAFCNSTEHLK